MAITEESRHHLFQRLEELLGHEEAVTLMEHLPPVGWAEVTTRRDLDHAHAMLTGDLDRTALHLRSEMTTLSTDLRAEMAALSTDLRTEMTTLSTDLRAEMAALSTDLRAEMAALSTDLRTEMTTLSTDLRAEMAAMEVRILTAFGDFRDQFHAEQRATSRQVILALVVALVSIVLATVGLR